MSHKWIPFEGVFPFDLHEGEGVSICTKCQRYIIIKPDNKGRVYINDKGYRSNQATFCDKRIQNTERNVVHLITEENFQVVQLEIPKMSSNSSLTDIEARLKEALVIINLIYADMKSHRVHTNALRMARDLLTSQGYKEIVEELDAKCA